MQAELNKNKKEEKINFNILKKKQKRPKNVGAIRVKKKKEITLILKSNFISPF